MSRVQALIEFNFPKLDDDNAKELARQLVENRGFPVASVRVANVRGEGKPFLPKAGKPGSVLMRDGRAYQVWSDGPNRGDLWVVPVEAQEGDASVYLTHQDAASTPRQYHGDGKPCASSWTTNADYSRTEVPCQHESHRRAA